MTTKGEHAALDLQQTTTEASASAPAPVDTDAKVQEDPADLGQAMSQLGKEGLLEHLSNRRASLMGTGMPAPLQTLPEEGSASTTRIPYSDAQVSRGLEGWQIEQHEASIPQSPRSANAPPSTSFARSWRPALHGSPSPLPAWWRPCCPSSAPQGQTALAWDMTC